MTEKKQLLRGILDFLDESVILPPGDWARGNLLPISQMMKVRRRRVKSWKPGGGVSCRESKNSNPGEGGGSRRNPFERTQIPFGGLVQDIRQRHFRSYWSDIKDGFHAQCLAAIIFIFFACLSGVLIYPLSNTNCIGGTFNFVWPKTPERHAKKMKMMAARH